MKNICLAVSYDGTRYSGFQIQENASTIQGELEKALAALYKEKVRITGAGRTDAGVHARRQVVNFNAPIHIPVKQLPAAVNSLLPEDIVTTGARKVPDRFDARFDARGKIYTYTLDRSPYPQVLIRRYSFHCPDILDLDSIKQAAAILEGKHDFKAFQASGGTVEDTVRSLSRVRVSEIQRDQLLCFTFQGDGFLYRMVRLLTGSLLRVGRGRLRPEELGLALTGELPRAAGPTVPARGLCLERVIY